MVEEDGWKSKPYFHSSMWFSLLILSSSQFYCDIFCLSSRSEINMLYLLASFGHQMKQIRFYKFSPRDYRYLEITNYTANRGE